MCDYCESPYGWRQAGGLYKCTDCEEVDEVRALQIRNLKLQNRKLVKKWYQFWK